MPRIGETSEVFECNFYTKSQKQVKRLIAGDGVYICDECVGLCSEIIEEEFPRIETFGLQEEFPKSREIRNFLDQCVIGWDAAKKALAVVVYSHYKRIMSKQTRIGRSHQGEKPVEVGKLGILLIGPTGCRRTYLAQTSAKMLNMPFAIADTTTLIEARYVGEDVENILLKFIQAAGFDIKRAETEIIYIDEIDKVMCKSGNPLITYDVSGEGVQQALLRVLEGIVAPVPPQGGRRHLRQDFPQIGITKVLFIVGRVSAGLDEIISSCIGKRPLGFSVDTSARKEVTGPFSETRPEDLYKSGLIPELIGCLPTISAASSLDRETLNRILVEPCNALAKQFTRLFELDGMQLDSTDETIDVVAEPALERNAGVRGLWAIPEELLLDVVLEVPSAGDMVQAVVICEVVLGKAQPELAASSHVARHRDLSA